MRVVTKSKFLSMTRNYDDFYHRDSHCDANTTSFLLEDIIVYTPDSIAVSTIGFDWTRYIVAKTIQVHIQPWTEL